MIRSAKSLRVYPHLNPLKSASGLFKRKLHDLLFALLVVLLPVQLGKYFWPEWTRVLGLRLDYLSPTLYLTDILVAGIIVSWIFKSIKATKCHSFREVIKPKKRSIYFGTLQLCIFAALIFILVNTSLASFPPVAIFKWLKLLEFSLLAFYVSKYRFALRTLHFVLPLAIIWSSLLAVFQFFNQASLGGVFWLLGERTFDIATPGIAKIDLAGRLFLRPYSTFSHPNSMAGFLLVALVLLNDTLRQNIVSSFVSKRSVFQNFVERVRNQSLNQASVRAQHEVSAGLPKILVYARTLLKNTVARLKLLNIDLVQTTINQQLTTYYIFDHLALVLGIVAIALSFSRSVWFVSLLVGLIIYFSYLKTKQFSRSTLFASALFWVILLGLFGFFMSRTGFAEPLAERIYLNEIAINMIKDHPLTGVGLNNFLVRLPDYWLSTGFVYLLQPVHNIILLVTAELGLVGLLGFLGLFGLTLRKLLKTGNWKLVIPVLVILSLGLVDHYWFTLQQNQLLLAIVLGLAWRKS